MKIKCEQKEKKKKTNFIKLPLNFFLKTPT